MFNHLHTYGNHPVPCAAGIKTIEILKRDKLVENAQAVGNYFLEGLQAMAHHPIVGEVRGVGMWTAIDFAVDKKTHAPLPVEHLINMALRAKNKGLILKLAPVRQAFEFAPPLTIQKGEIDEALKIIEECISEEEKEMGL